MVHYGDPLSYAFGYAISKFPGYFTRKYDYANWLNKANDRYRKMYYDTSIDAYEWRSKHSEDPVFGYWLKKANNRDLYEEKKKYQEDLKRNTGFNWRDNAYPRSAYGSAFAYSGSHKSPAFEVNDAIMQLYNGVKRW